MSAPSSAAWRNSWWHKIGQFEDSLRRKEDPPIDDLVNWWVQLPLYAVAAKTMSDLVTRAISSMVV